MTSSLQPWEVGSVDSHFTDGTVETEGSCSASHRVVDNLKFLKLCVREIYMDTILNNTDLHVGKIIPFPILFQSF